MKNLNIFKYILVKLPEFGEVDVALYGKPLLISYGLGSWLQQEEWIHIFLLSSDLGPTEFSSSASIIFEHIVPNSQKQSSPSATFTPYFSLVSSGLRLPCSLPFPFPLCGTSSRICLEFHGLNYYIYRWFWSKYFHPKPSKVFYIFVSNNMLVIFTWFLSSTSNPTDPKWNTSLPPKSGFPPGCSHHPNY